MSFFSRFQSNNPAPSQPLSPELKRKRIWRIVFFFLALIVIAGAVTFFKAGYILKKISFGRESVFTSLVKSLPGADNTLVGEKEGKINILLMGMRGQDDPNGGLLADTIMVLSIHPSQQEGDAPKASLVSIPRDLYVQDPSNDSHSKVNAVYFLGEKRQANGGGMEDMQKVIGEVTGMEIPYSVVLDFKGFTNLVDAIGGITVHLDKPFEESLQFRGVEARCDGVKFTVPTGNSEAKRIQRKNGTYYKNLKYYPLCVQKLSTIANPEDLECGGDFKLPAGDNQLNSTQALCFARARYQSSDFERARRQQQVIQAIKDKALSIGTLSDFSKINGMLDSLGDSVRTNLKVSEMKRLFDIYQKNPNPTLTQKVLENSEEGLLYAPPETKETGYILRPIGDNYDKIHALFQSLP